MIVEPVIKQPWMAINNGSIVLGWPPLVILVTLLLLSMVFSLVFLQSLAPERRQSLKNLFRNALIHALAATVLFLGHSLLKITPLKTEFMQEFVRIFGALTLMQWTIFAIKLGRVLIFVGLFSSNMRVAFPLLFVNLATLLLALGIFTVLGSELFNIQVVPLLATSAVVSIILGIALQDTLGNLFAGVALQMDKPYEMDDWVEIQNGSQKWVGKVHEISWRATLLLSLSEEMVTIPNRIMAQATVLNFSVSKKPFYKSHSVRLPYCVNVNQVKEAFLAAALRVDGVAFEPNPLVVISEANESGLIFRIIYAISEYQNQLTISDKVLSEVLTTLNELNIGIAPARLLVVKEKDEFNFPHLPLEQS